MPDLFVLLLPSVGVHPRNAATLSEDTPQAVHNLHRPLARVPARLHCKQHKQMQHGWARAF